jgi:tetratricopeptide (TPR) repeat protein
MVAPSSPVETPQASFEEALARGQHLLEKDPAAALKQAEALVRLKQDARVYRLAAAACRKLGYEADAEGAELGAIKASLDRPEMKEAALAEADGRSEDALRIAEQYLEGNPDDLLAMTIAAEALTTLWDFERAESLLRSVLTRAPTFLRGSTLLATCLSKHLRPRQAITVLEEALRRKPDQPQLLSRLAHLKASVGDNDDAVLIFEKLVARDAGNAGLWHNLADQYRIVGRRDESIAAYRKSLSIDPRNATAWWTIANYFPKELDDSDEQAVRNALMDKAGTAEEGPLELTLGLLADRDGERRQAFNHFAAGKAIKLRHQPYDPAPISAAVDRVIETFTPEFYQRRSSSGWLDPSPVFIIGMLRSGTTLVDRVLGRHSALESTSELKIMPQLAEIARHEMADLEDYAELLENLPASQISSVGQRYVEASRDYRRTEKPHFIDKNNLNWMQVGLILLALPQARIIDMRRNALDCCWANFKMLFSQHFPATNDLRHVGRFYRDYVRLFDAMKQAAPDRILSVRYEEVVDDLEGQTRRMLDFLSLDFEPQCLDFHLAEGAVATASSEQVRRPLNREGIGSAEPYRQWLAPLIEELGPLAEQSN